MGLYTIVDQENCYAGSVWERNGNAHYTRYKSHSNKYSKDKQVMECRRCELQENINKTSMKYIFQVINEDVNLKKCVLTDGDCEVIQGKFIKVK